MSHPNNTPARPSVYAHSYDPEQFTTLRGRLIATGVVLAISVIGLIAAYVAALLMFPINTWLFIGMALLAVPVVFVGYALRKTHQEYHPVAEERAFIQKAYHLFSRFYDPLRTQPKRASFILKVEPVTKDNQKMLQVTLEPKDRTLDIQMYLIGETFADTVTGPNLSKVLPGLEYIFSNPDTFGNFEEQVSMTFVKAEARLSMDSKALGSVLDVEL